MGTPDSVIQSMQKVQNAAACLILSAPRHKNCTPLPQQFHWLPVFEQIKCKTACMYYNTITGSGPSYLSELLHLYSPSRSLHSSWDTYMHAQTPTLQPQNTWLSHFLTLRPPHLEQSPPRHQALCYSLFLQKQTRDISLCRIFQLRHIVLHLYQSVQCVCVCVCTCVRACARACVHACVCILHIVMLELCWWVHYVLALIKLNVLHLSGH